MKIFMFGPMLGAIVDDVFVSYLGITQPPSPSGFRIVRALSIPNRCDVAWKDLYREPAIMKYVLYVWRSDGVPRHVPGDGHRKLTRRRSYGSLDRESGGHGWDKSIGSFLKVEARPIAMPPSRSPTENTCQGGASWSNSEANRNYDIKECDTAFYWAAHMVNLNGSVTALGVHQTFPSAASSSIAPDSPHLSYALHRETGIGRFPG